MTTDDNHNWPPADKIYILDEQAIVLNDINSDGWILDIGGGGEGVIGQLKNDRVIAIDNRRRELEETPAGPLKIVMDARHLVFLDKSFRYVTAFYTFMYMDEKTVSETFTEISRVLQNNGHLLIWDINLPPDRDNNKQLIAFRLKVKLPHEEINTAFGTKWPTIERSPEFYTELAEKVGLSFVKRENFGESFYLEFTKT